MSYLPVALRAYALQRKTEKSPRSSSKTAKAKWPESVLIIDTETTTDPTQRLLFGTYRYCRWHGERLECVEEGLFHPDELAETDLHGFHLLQEYTRTHRAHVVAGQKPALCLMSRREFLERLLWLAAWKARALVVGFNLPFDLSRLAVEWGSGHGRYRNGFSLTLWTYRDKKTGRYGPNKYRPRILIKPIDNKRAFNEFGSLHELDEGDFDVGAWLAGSDPGPFFRGHFLDLKTLCFALTNEGHSLDSACGAFDVEHGKQKTKRHGEISEAYIDYNRRDVLATQELLEKLRGEFDRHPINLDPCKAYSPASIAKAYLRAMGIKPPRERFQKIPPQLLGRTMTAYYGGRAECRIRREIVPVVYLDFLSMYPTVNTLMGLWRLLTAERLQVEDCTAEAQALLDGVSTEACFDPSLWQRLPFFARVIPDGHLLPVRARYGAGDDFAIGVNPFTAKEAVWYAGPDLVAATMLSGKAPKVTEAFRLVAVGWQKALRAITLRGAIPVDPRCDDFFRAIIEQRQRLKRPADLPREERDRLDAFLKVLANSGSYGIFAEMNREELPAKKHETVTVYGLDEPFSAETNAPETPGPFCFPPIAPLIPAAAHLMLALLERCVTDAGGSYAFCDTDSMAIVATETGGLVPCAGGPCPGQHIKALSWKEVDAIVERFAALNPYDRAAVSGSILKIEDENLAGDERRQLYVCVISAKRYALFNLNSDGNLIIRKYSEHGLGHLLNPTDPDDESRDWIEQLWRCIVLKALGQPAETPAWLDRPAIRRITASTPEIVNRLTQSEKKLPYARRIKPFNFVLAAHVAPFGHPQGVDPTQFQLIAPYTPDASRWTKIAWTDRYSGQTFHIITAQTADASLVRVKSYADVMAEYETHPEPKSTGADGKPCSRSTRGLLARRHVHAASIVYIGKESNRLEDVEDELVHDWEEVREVYVDPKSDPWVSLVVPILKLVPRATIARSTGLKERSIQALRNGRSQPRPRTRALLTRAAADFARTRLGLDAPADDLAACAAFLSLQPATCPG